MDEKKLEDLSARIGSIADAARNLAENLEEVLRSVSAKARQGEAPKPESVPRNSDTPKYMIVLDALRRLCRVRDDVSAREVAEASGVPSTNTAATLTYLESRGLAERTKRRVNGRPLSFWRPVEQTGQAPEPPLPDPPDDATAVRLALHRLETWATVTEIHEEAEHGRDMAWTLSELREMRERGEVEYQFGPHPYWSSEDAHLYRVAREPAE